MSDSPDRLYELLPAIYRVRDAERGYPLRDLLRVIAEQVNAVEEDITQLYDNWFIETAQDWVVPYIADLVGYTPVVPAGDPRQTPPAEARALTPRREVANTIAYRRRRGTLSVLEDLAQAVARWPARAVEMFRLLTWTQNLNHQHSRGHRARLASLRSADALDTIGTPFDPFARTVEVRRVISRYRQGRYNIPSVALWVWRLGAYSITRAPAYCLDAGKNSYTFSALGNDSPLFTLPEPEPGDTHIAREINVPTPIRRRALDADKERYYGEGKSFEIWADWAGHDVHHPLPAEAIIPADLSDWYYTPPEGKVAVDPQLGRIQFPTHQLPSRHVRVSYHTGFSAEMGGGEYPRRLSQHEGAQVIRVGEGEEHKKLSEAFGHWRHHKPRYAVIEITDSRAYTEPIHISLGPDQSLQLRAAGGKRPMIRLLDWQTDASDSLLVHMDNSSEITLDGLLIAGRGMTVVGPPRRETHSVCGARVNIRHCTLVPGWSLDVHCKPQSPNKESIELRDLRAQVSIDHSILGPITVVENEVHSEPIPIEITDSIVDAMSDGAEAIGGPQGAHAHAVLTVRRSTVLGVIQAHAMALGEDSIFQACVHVARRQLGCMRFCYVPAGCRTPRRYACQPDLVMEAQAGEDGKALEAERVRPQYTSRRYGNPAYAQLSRDGAREIFEGASDGAEMGAFHDLFQPQRLAILRARLEEFTPAGMEAGVLFAD